MKKILIAIAFSFCGITAFSQIFVPVNPTVWGSNNNRVKVKIVLLIPEKDTTLEVNSNDTTGVAQIFYRYADSSFWGWSHDRGYFKLIGGSGGGSIIGDSTTFYVDGLIDTCNTCHPGFQTLIVHPEILDSLKHQYIDTGSVMHDGYVLAFDSVARSWKMVAMSGGGSGGGGLNIYNGDSVLSGNRIVGLNGNYLNISDLSGVNTGFLFVSPSASYLGFFDSVGTYYGIMNMDDSVFIGTYGDNGTHIGINDVSKTISMTNIASGSITDSILTRDATTGIVHAIDRSLLGGSETLQQVFDVQSANALLNKDDTITVNSHTLFVGDAFGGQLNGLEIDPGQFSGGTAYSSSGNRSQITMASDGSGASAQLSATNQVGGFHSPTLFLNSSISEGDATITADSVNIQSGGYSSASSGDVWTLINPVTGSGYWHPTASSGVINIATGYGLSGGPITSTGTVLSDTSGAKATSSNTGYLSNIDWIKFDSAYVDATAPNDTTLIFRKLNGGKDTVVFHGGGGAGTVTNVLGTTGRITSTGGTAPIIDVGTEVTLNDSTQTLVNKTISGSSNTFSNIDDGSLSTSYIKADGTRALTGNWDIGGNKITFTKTGATANTIYDGLVLQNTTTASSGNQMYGGFFHSIGQGWKTTATAASQSMDFSWGTLPIQGTTNPTGALPFYSSINGGANTESFRINSSNNVWGASAQFGGSSGIIISADHIISPSNPILYFTIPTSTTTEVRFNSSFAGNTGTSGTTQLYNFFGSFNPASGTPTNNFMYLQPTIGWGGTPGAGSYNALRINVTETAIPTGTNYLINTGTGGNTLFGVRNSGKIELSNTITAGGTTGNQTINKPSGTVNIAASGTSVTVTNSLVTTSSIVYAVIRTNDATATGIKNIVPSSGSFVITLNAAATAEVSIGFIVFN